MACRVAATLLMTVSFFQMALCQDMGKKTLQCYRCGFDQPCVEKIVTCKEGESCGTIKGNLDYKVHDSIFKKDCISAHKCGSHDKISYWGNPYRVTFRCCNTDLCNTSFSRNGAPHFSIAHLPLLLAVSVLTILFTSSETICSLCSKWTQY